MPSFAFLLVVSMILGLKETESKCPPHEVEVECINFCNTCELHTKCQDMCVPGCDCIPGFLRNKLGECVPREQCHLLLGDQNLRCPLNEHFNPCRAHCQKNCNNYKMRVICPFICVPGCVCDRGFVRDRDNKCIKKVDCHTSENKFPTFIDNTSCPENEEMSSCHGHCQRNCSNYQDPILNCPKICVAGCVCKGGLVRGPGNNCISSHKCLMKRSFEEDP